MYNRYDIIIDATDNITTRYLLSDAGVLAGKPVVSGSALRTDGQVSSTLNITYGCPHSYIIAYYLQL